MDAYPDPDDFELAVDAAASVAAGAAAQGFPVRVLTGDGPLVETRGGPHDIELILDRLARLDRARGARTRRWTSHAAYARAGRSWCSPGRAGEISRAGSLRRRFDRVVCVRVRPEAPGPGLAGIALIEMADLDELRAAWRGAMR